MKNKLTIKNIETMDKILDKCSDIQLLLAIDQCSKKLYDRLNKKG